MTYTILCVVALICVSGFIAYFGDVLGRRMGKKRLTLFNMRPRHTAIVVTTITGMLISTLALATLFSVNSQFRKVLLRGEQILSQNKQLSTANIDLAKRSKELRLQVAKQKRELADAQQDATLAKKQRDTAVQRVAGLRREIAVRQQEIAVRQQELAALRTQKNIAQSELDMRRADLRLAQVDLRNAETKLRNAQSQLATAQQKLGATEASLKDTEGKLEYAEGKLAQTTDMSGAATDFVYRMRVNGLAFREGDEFARGTIKPAQSAFAIKADILSLLSRASEKVLAEHARVGVNGRAVTLMYWPAPDKERVEPNDDERECIDIIAKQIAASESDVVAQVICGMNTLADAQVPIEIRLYNNKRVYAAGDKISSISIDGGESEGTVLLALNGFLRTDVAKTAVKAGLVSIAGQDASTLLGPNPQAQADELLQAVAKIKSTKAAVNVSVYATSDVYTSDSINLSNIRLVVE